MRIHGTKTTLATLLILAALGLGSCKNDGVNAPSSGTVTLRANPGTVIIDAVNGEEEGKTTVTAMVLSEGGFPLKDILVSFTSDAGVLDSAGDPDDPGTPPTLLLTDVNGLVSDVLTVDLAAPSEIEVLGTSGGISGSITVLKSIDFGDNPAVAVLSFSPKDQQEIDRSVIFSGAGSNDPDGASISCYQFRVNNDFVQGTDVSFQTTFATEQALNVSLRVSSDPLAPSSFCNECNDFTGDPEDCGTLSSDGFSGVIAQATYAILCDLTPPTAGAGLDRVAVLNGAEVSVTLTAALSDDQYRWVCNDSFGTTSSSRSVTCRYSATGSYEAVLTVRNPDCPALDSEDRTTVTINPPAGG